jgi:hypothetical protein
VDGSNRNARREIAPLAGTYFEFVAAGTKLADVEVAVAAARACDLPRLRALCVAVSDPLAWVPLFRCLASVPDGSRTPAIDAGLRRLYGLASELLREQGLGVLRPEDVVLTDSPLEQALSSLCSS